MISQKKFILKMINFCIAIRSRKFFKSPAKNTLSLHQFCPAAFFEGVKEYSMWIIHWLKWRGKKRFGDLWGSSDNMKLGGIGIHHLPLFKMTSYLKLREDNTTTKNFITHTSDINRFIEVWQQNLFWGDRNSRQNFWHQKMSNEAMRALVPQRRKIRSGRSRRKEFSSPWLVLSQHK